MPQKSPQEKKNVKIKFFYPQENTNKAIENAMKNYGFLETTRERNLN